MSPHRSKTESSPLVPAVVPISLNDSFTEEQNQLHSPSAHPPVPKPYRWQADVSAGITVSLINIPLSISLSVAAQSSPAAGIVAAVWSGLFCSLLGGSAFNITGPTGALAGILTRYAILFGSSSLPLLAITSSVLIFVTFLFGWHKYAQFLPSSVTQGFTIGIAVLIVGSQLPAALGLGHLPLKSHFFSNLWIIIQHIQEADWRAFALFLLAWIILFSLVKSYPGRPWSILIAAAGISIGLFSQYGWLFPVQTLYDRYGELSFSLWNHPVGNSTMLDNWTEVLNASFSIAFVSVLESLISGKIADGLTGTHMNERREVFGLAVANLVSGLAGGIPTTAALARTALNINAGAQSRYAGITSSLATGFIALLLLPLFSLLPLSIVAALLFQVAVGMVETKHFMNMYRVEPSSFQLTLLVAVLCLLFDPTVGILLGGILSLLHSAEQSAVGYSEIIITENLQQGIKLDAQHLEQELERTSDTTYRNTIQGRTTDEVTSSVK